MKYRRGVARNNAGCYHINEMRCFEKGFISINMCRNSEEKKLYQIIYVM